MHFSQTDSRQSRSVGRNTVSFIARRPELGAENDTMRIAAKRSFWKYRLERPNPKFWMVYEGVGVRSGEVGWSRLKVAGIFWGIFWSSWWIWKLRLCQNRNLFMLYRSILVSGAGFIKIMCFLAREGSMFDDFVAEKIDWDIDFLRPARRGDFNFRASKFIWTSKKSIMTDELKRLRWCTTRRFSHRTSIVVCVNIASQGSWHTNAADIVHDAPTIRQLSARSVLTRPAMPNRIESVEKIFSCPTNHPGDKTISTTLEKSPVAQSEQRRWRQIAGENT